VQLDLHLQRPQFVPGDQVGVAVEFDIQAGWHINPGLETGEADTDFALPTEIEVELPEGWRTTGPIWPASEEIEVFGDPLRVYEYDNVVFLPLVVPPDVEPGAHAIRVVLSYQACDDSGICEFPASVETAREVVVVGPGATVEAPTPETAAIFADYDPTRAGEYEVPEAEDTESGPTISDTWSWYAIHAMIAVAMLWMIVQTWSITGSWSYRVPVTVVGLATVIGWTPITRAQTSEGQIEWLPYSQDVFEEARAARERVVFVEFTADWCINCHYLERTVLESEQVRAILNSDEVIPFKADVTASDAPGHAMIAELGGGGIPITAIYHPGEPEPRVLRSIYSVEAITAALTGGPVEAAAEGRSTFDFLGAEFTVDDAAWPLILGLAAIAGFFLNLTPCVLPVIPIKILSLQAHAKDPARCFLLGLVFSLGIVALFAILGLFIAGLKIGDWGAIFAYWWVNLILGGFIAVMGLGMLGLFSMNLPQAVYMFNPQSDSLRGSFLTGMFAGVLSTPCTGPLLGATIAWLLTQGALLGMLTFVVMGIGMAAPYVLLTAKPSWLSKVPHSGPGSELVKQVMGLLLIGVSMFFFGVGVRGLGV